MVIKLYFHLPHSRRRLASNAGPLKYKASRTGFPKLKGMGVETWDTW